MKIEIFTDGSCTTPTAGQADGRGGYAALLFADGVLIDGIYGGHPATTNNRMELQGLIAGMRLIPTVSKLYCKNCGLTDHLPSGVQINDTPIEKFAGASICGDAVCVEYGKHVVKTPLYVGATIYSDSQYCVKGANGWIEGWKANGWKTKSKTPVLNQEFWQEVDALKKVLNPNFVWVKGHAANVGNQQADKWAGIAANLFPGTEWNSKMSF